MLTHPERVALAEAVCARVAACHPEVIVAGIYGSTARGTDTPWSDLELLFVTMDGSSLPNRQFIYRDTAVSLVAIEERRLEQAIANPHGWEYWMGVLSSLRLLHGREDQIRKWTATGQTVPQEAFRRALEESLSWIVTEPYGRIMSCRQRGGTSDIVLSLTELLFDIRGALSLLNGRWVTHNRSHQGLIESLDFPKVPERYAELLSALWQAHGPDEIAPIVEELTGSFWRLLQAEGVRMPRNYQSVDELPLERSQPIHTAASAY
jgi:predicted nucleotidyltransferase